MIQRKDADMGILSSKRTPRPKRDENGDRVFGWDGKTPNTDAGKRFYRQRESGYEGWLDQDSHRVDKDGNRTGGDV
jgi:hypothetical protein